MDGLGALVNLWLSKIELARERKEEEFQRDANDAMRFYNGPHDFLYASPPEDVPRPTFKVTINKVAELVQLFLPFLLHRNPVRTVTPRKGAVPPDLLMALGLDPAMTASTEIKDRVRALLLQWHQNITPVELGLKWQSRMAITEALVKGRGVLWTEVVHTTRGKTVGSFYQTVDDLQLDPDGGLARECKWAARLRMRPTWEVEEAFKLPSGSVKGNRESYDSVAKGKITPDGDHNRRTGGSNDLLFYWEVYSRMGIGTRLSGAPPEWKNAIESFGEGVFLAIAPGIDYPLNLPPWVFESTTASSEIPYRLAWPTPFHRDAVQPWPFLPLDFHYVPGKVWPMSHIKPAMGEQKFLDWAYSFLADKMQVTGRQIVLLDDASDKDLEDVLFKRGDLLFVKIKRRNNEPMKNAIEVVTFDSMNKDMYNVISMVEQSFERRTGMTPLLYGSTSQQMRSATEASVLDKNVQIRPDDMQGTTEDWSSLVARNEAIAARYHLTGQDVAPAFGETSYGNPGMEAQPPGLYSSLWQALVYSQDIDAILAECEYRIEAGSGRKPNRADTLASIDESAQVILPMLMQVYQGMGDPTQINAWMRQWAEARGFDASPFMLPPIQMQPQADPGTVPMTGAA